MSPHVSNATEWKVRRTFHVVIQVRGPAPRLSQGLAPQSAQYPGHPRFVHSKFGFKVLLL